MKAIERAWMPACAGMTRSRERHPRAAQPTRGSRLLSDADADQSGNHEDLEKYEGMERAKGEVATTTLKAAGAAPGFALSRTKAGTMKAMKCMKGAGCPPARA